MQHEPARELSEVVMKNVNKSNFMYIFVICQNVKGIVAVAVAVVVHVAVITY